jgi:Fe-S-cluster containining protein
MLSRMGPAARDSQLVQIGDSQLLQIIDAALADAAHRAGAWLACKPGCTQCCHGAFAINALDTARLHTGMQALRAATPEAAKAIEERARAWTAAYGPEFPGDATTGVLGTSEEDQARFEDFANDAPCPALNPQTGLCDVYPWRPMMCRVFGPPTRMAPDEPLGEAQGDSENLAQNDPLACCELCFVGASEAEIAACEMPVPLQLERELLAAAGDARETVVAFALLR